MQDEWLTRARAVLPEGGFGNFDPNIVIREGRGARVWDEDGGEYVDFLIGSGPMILGHGHPEVIEAVERQLSKGMTFFANNTSGIELAEEICRAVPCADQVRFVSTGGEADMYAMRLARAFTGRDKIMKFEGGYHGMSAEAQMSLAPTKLVDFPKAVPDSAGIPQSVLDDMLVAPFNDIDFAVSLIAENADVLAAVIVEPLQRIVPPKPGFLEALREACSRHDVLLIFDEVVTGFRFAYGGAQELYGVTPDLCSLGKVIGGGLPLAAVAGREDIMAHFDPGKVGRERSLMQIGTLSGNPLAAAAGLKTMEILRRPGQYETLHAFGQRLMDTLTKRLSDAGHPHRIVGHQAMFDVVFTGDDVESYRDVLRADATRNATFNATLRRHQVFKAPGKVYPSLALTEEDFQVAEAAIEQAVASLDR